MDVPDATVLLVLSPLPAEACHSRHGPVECDYRLSHRLDIVASLSSAIDENHKATSANVYRFAKLKGVQCLLASKDLPTSDATCRLDITHAVISASTRMG